MDDAYQSYLVIRERCRERGECHRSKGNTPEACCRTTKTKGSQYTEFLGECTCENCWRIREGK